MPANSQGVSSKRYALIPRTLIFLFRGEEILLIKGAPQKRIWANLYNGIGGHVEQGESILSAARRELFEESRIVPGTLWLCGVVTIDTGEQPGICLFIFRGEGASGIETTLQPSPEGDLEWIAISRVFDLPLVEDLPLLLPRVLQARQDEPPFYAQYTYDESNQLSVRFD